MTLGAKSLKTTFLNETLLVVTTDNQIKNYFLRELFILYKKSQRSHVESINILRQGTLVFFKGIYRDSNLRALS